MLTEIYCSYQYLSTDPKKVFNAHKLQKIVSMNADISETIKEGELGFPIKIPQPCTQREIVTRICHAHSKAHKPTKPVAPTIFMLDRKF